MRRSWIVVGAAALLATALGAACTSSSPRSATARARGGGSSTRPSTSSSTSTTTVATATPDCPSPPRAQPDANRPRYTLDVDVRPADAMVDGTLSVRFTPDLATDRLVFRLWPNGPRTAAAGAHLDAGPVTLDGRPAAARLDAPTTLVVPVPGGVRAGQTITTAMPWHLRLPGAVDDRVSRSGDAVRLGSFFPILPWEPGVGWDVDPPTSASAEAATSPTADFALTVTTPAGVGVLASGVPDGHGHWTANAMRDIAISTGHFTLAHATAHAPDPVAVTVGVDSGVSESPEPYAQKAARIIEEHSRRFGPYPWPTYTIAITPALRGGIEYPTEAMQGPGTIGRTTSHELGHQWFYALVGDDQARDPFLDEGLASWAEARAEGTLPMFQSRAIPANAAGQLGEPMSYWETRQSSYYLGVYAQGVQALAALGPPDRVDCALRVYAALDAYRIARPRDLITALTRVFPNAPDVFARFGVRP